MSINYKILIIIIVLIVSTDNTFLYLILLGIHYIITFDHTHFQEILILIVL